MSAETLDRVAPTRRPEGRPLAGRQRWRDLLFVHWPIPAEALRPLIPEGLHIDTFEEQAFVGVVPFSMEGVQPWWLPFGMDFLETNLRTYVHIHGEPGVWFFSLDAASWLAVQAARLGWSLPYHHATMHTALDGAVRHYTTTRRSAPQAALAARWRVGPALGPSMPGSLEHFLLERYLLFSQQRGRLYRGQVYHTPYPAHAAELISLSEGLIAAAGLPAPQTPPPLVHCSPGVDVEIFGLTPL